MSNYIVSRSLEAFYETVAPKFRDVCYEKCKTLHGADFLFPVDGWLENPVQNLFFFGGPGTGKTYLSLALLHKLIKDGRLQSGDYMFRTAARIDEDLLAAQRGELDSSEGYLMKGLRETPLLILDDFGRENTTPRVIRQFFDIIDHRMNWRRKTIINTNLSLNEISKRYDPALCSRLQEWQMLNFKGPDLRVTGGYKL